MTPIAFATSPSTQHLLAGFEFSRSEVAGLVAFFAIAALIAVGFLATFVANLVSSAQRLHRAGRLRHPAITIAIPLLALLLAFPTRTTLAAPLFLAGALTFGYAVMWRSGHGWFRWTAVPMLPWIVALVGTR